MKSGASATSCGVKRTRLGPAAPRLAMILLAAAVGLGLVAGGLVQAAEPAAAKGAAATDGPAFQAQLQDTLDWLDRYLADEVLFRREDIRRIREKVANMSPAELQTWLKETKQLRAQLESPKWQKTREFLKEILTKTKLFSKEQVEQLRADVAKMTPEQLSNEVKRLEQKRDTFLQKRSAFNFQRGVQVARDAQQLRQQAQSDQRLRTELVQESESQQRTEAAAARQAAASERSSRLLFGNTQAHAVSRLNEYRPPPPLITSEEVARATVYRSLFPGWDWGW